MKNLKLILAEAIQRRIDFFRDNSNTCFRLFNSLADGIEGLTIDLYGEYLLGQSFHKSVQSHESAIAEIASEICAKMGKSIEGVLWKQRWNTEIAHAEARSRLVVGRYPPEKYSVLHNGMRLLCDLVTGQNTGIFMDMREVRYALLSFYPKFDSMLNLFSYTGAFSVHARLAGVSQCINVDSSKSAHARAKENYRLNGLQVDERDFIVGDVGKWLKVFAKRKMSFSFIVYDPPTFSRAKSSHYSVRKDFARHCELLNELASGGYVLTAVNTVSIPPRVYFSYHPCEWESIFFKNEACDFRFSQSPYLKVALWKVP
ncbi:MAG: class I SAM-dependent methyltransferase [Spirochaetes bacterium]|nr:class I SAM-dependent methyltransferase [Spirochaetota bacterium]